MKTESPPCHRCGQPSQWWRKGGPPNTGKYECPDCIKEQNRA